MIIKRVYLNTKSKSGVRNTQDMICMFRIFVCVLVLCLRSVHSVVIPF